MRLFWLMPMTAISIASCGVEEGRATSDNRMVPSGSPEKAAPDLGAQSYVSTVADSQDGGADRLALGAQDGSDWSARPPYRKEFESCWNAAVTAEAKMACISAETAWQEPLLERAFAGASQSLSERELGLLLEEQIEWKEQASAACEAGAGDPIDVHYCRMYRTAMRAYELQTIVELDKRER